MDESAERADPDDRTDTADRVVVSFPEDLSEWGRDQLERDSYRRYLLKVHESASEGDVWEEVVDIGCCGSTLDVPLRVERVDGGSRLTTEATLEYDVREAAGIEGSWQAQGEGGPSRA